jgi:hypothetical protein
MRDALRYRKMSKTNRAAAAFILCALFLIPLGSTAQSTNEEYRRVSLSLQAGITMSYETDINRLIGSNYNTFTRQTYNFGGGVQYAISPFWSAELGYRYNTIEGLAEDGFETVVHSATLKNIFNFNRLYRRSSVSDWLNPYLVLGYEHDFYRYELGDETNSGNESAILGGFGLAFSLSHTFDLFAQYEVKLASNRMDNINRGFPVDQVGMPSAGVRINFGRSGTKPLSLSPPVKFLTDQEYDTFLARSEELREASDEIREQRRLLNDLDERFKRNETRYQEQIDRLDAFTRLLEERIDTLEYRLDNLEISFRDTERERERQLRTEVPAGHYVQVFAATSYDAANRVKEMFHEILGDEFDNPEEVVFVIKRRQYYEVLIGTFYRFSDAQRSHELARVRLSDAFIITFPRPLHLADQYEGTEIIWD